MFPRIAINNNLIKNQSFIYSKVKLSSSSISDNLILHKSFLYMSHSSIWPIDRALSGTTTPGLSVPEGNTNEGVFRISQSITEASPSDCFVSYLGHTLEDSYPPAEMHSEYSEATADGAVVVVIVVAQDGWMLTSSITDKIMKPVYSGD